MRSIEYDMHSADSDVDLVGQSAFLDHFDEWISGPPLRLNVLLARIGHAANCMIPRVLTGITGGTDVNDPSAWLSYLQPFRHF